MTITVGNIVNRPVGKVDANVHLNQYSFNDAEFRGDNNATTNLVYLGWAKPGSPTSNGVWQIRKLTYDANGNVISIQWPLNASGAVSSDYEFIWDNRAALNFV